jgi:hypothetical protein
MGIFDDMTGSNFTDSTDDIQARFSELRDREESGTLDDAGRAELQQLRDRMRMGEE